MRAKRGQIDEVDERSGLDVFARGVHRRSFHVAGQHRRGDQSDGQSHDDVSWLGEEHYSAKTIKHIIISPTFCSSAI